MSVRLLKNKVVFRHLAQLTSQAGLPPTQSYTTPRLLPALCLCFAKYKYGSSWTESQNKNPLIFLLFLNQIHWPLLMEKLSILAQGVYYSQLNKEVVLFYTAGQGDMVYDTAELGRQV